MIKCSHPLDHSVRTNLVNLGNRFLVSFLTSANMLFTQQVKYTDLYIKLTCSSMYVNMWGLYKKNIDRIVTDFMKNKILLHTYYIHNTYTYLAWFQFIILFLQQNVLLHKYVLFLEWLWMGILYVKNTYCKCRNCLNAWNTKWYIVFFTI